jgi:hypothetical protein
MMVKINPFRSQKRAFNGFKKPDIFYLELMEGFSPLLSQVRATQHLTNTRPPPQLVARKAFAEPAMMHQPPSKKKGAFAWL